MSATPKKGKAKKEEPAGMAVLSSSGKAPLLVGAAGSSAPTQVTDDKEIDKSGWTDIADERKLRYDTMKKKKAQKAAEDAAKKLKEKKPLNAEEQAAVDKVAEEKAVEDEKVAAKKDKGPSQPKKKKSHKTQLLVITNEKQLIEACVGILNNVPNGEHIHLSVIGDRLHEQTGHSWNKKYKQTYGTLPQFLGKHPDHFHVNSEQVVFLRAEYNAIKAASDPLGSSKKKKKSGDKKLDSKGEGDKKAEGVIKSAATGVIPEVTKKRRRRHESGTEEDVDDDDIGTSTTLRLIFVALLVLVVMLFTFISLEGVSFAEFVERVRANFK